MLVVFFILLFFIVLGAIGTFVTMEIYGWDSKYVSWCYLTSMISCLIVVLLSPVFAQAIEPLIEHSSIWIEIKRLYL